MREEIGSEFWDVPLQRENNGIFSRNTKWFISGTSALEYILVEIAENMKIEKVAIPSWCCSCMIMPFLNNNIKVDFYPVYINENRELTCDYSKASDCDAFLILDYFGYTYQKSIGEPAGIIIRDLTHSIFSKKYDDADYYFGSLRKWAGFWTGGYAWTSKKWVKKNTIENIDEFYINLRRKAMEDKIKYLIGESNNKKYLDLFKEAEDYLDHCGIVSGCSRDIEMAFRLNIDLIKKQRRKNALIILNYLKDISIFPELDDEDCPLFVPITMPHHKRNLLRKYLIERNIYCPIHWGETGIHQLSEKTRKIYDTELSIICDQRYSEEQIEKIIFWIDKFNRKN